MIPRQFLELLESEIPLTLAMQDDPVGIQIDAGGADLTTVAVVYEVNEEMVARAGDAGAEVIVAFHPLIYPSLKRITQQTRVERVVIELIRRGIALYIVHTAFDAHPEGTSALFARAMGLGKITPLIRSSSDPEAGMGAIGEFAEPKELAEVADLVRSVSRTESLRLSSPPGSRDTSGIRKIAIVGGSGMSFYDHAVKAGADAYITADVRYHAFHAANDMIPILDPGHAESERFVVDGIATILERGIAHRGLSIAVVRIEESTNPVRYIN